MRPARFSVRYASCLCSARRATSQYSRMGRLTIASPASGSIDQDLDALSALVGNVENCAAAPRPHCLEEVIDHPDARHVAETPCETEAKADHPDRDRDIGAHAAGVLVR